MGQALWIGGPPGAGKTTVATRLVRRHGLRYYNADAHTWTHRDRALAAGSEAAQRWERWRHAPTALPAEELLALSLHRERAGMAVDDVRALPEAPLVVAEGTVVSPALVAEPGRSVWLLPTPNLQRDRLEARDGSTLELYLLLAGRLEREVREHGAPVVTLDGTRTIDETVAAVEELFADALASGPRARSRPERRALLREANVAQVEQIRSFHARPWAGGDPETVERRFICECGEPTCTAEVAATVGAVAERPALAAGH